MMKHKRIDDDDGDADATTTKIAGKGRDGMKIIREEGDKATKIIGEGDDFTTMVGQDSNATKIIGEGGHATSEKNILQYISLVEIFKE
uniref:Uncharacterized protein n=1 Tax=Romanomermis culicivorax TaxID=13658 RepID=A0A915KZ73_ROMCU